MRQNQARRPSLGLLRPSCPEHEHNHESSRCLVPLSESGGGSIFLRGLFGGRGWDPARSQAALTIRSRRTASPPLNSSVRGFHFGVSDRRKISRRCCRRWHPVRSHVASWRSLSIDRRFMVMSHRGCRHQAAIARHNWHRLLASHAAFVSSPIGYRRPFR